MIYTFSEYTSYIAAFILAVMPFYSGAASSDIMLTLSLIGIPLLLFIAGKSKDAKIKRDILKMNQEYREQMDAGGPHITDEDVNEFLGKNHGTR